MADGSVSSGNLDSWLLLLGALGGILTGSLWLRNIQHGRWACALVIVPAIPLLGFVVILMVAIVTGARWN